MKRSARIGLIAVSSLVACEAVGTIGLHAPEEASTSSLESSTTDAIEDVHAGSSSDNDSSEGGSTEGGSTDGPGDDNKPASTDPSSGGDDTSTTSGDEGPDTLSADLGSSEMSGTDDGGGVEGCCAAQDSPGCGDIVVESCVCELDPYCCDEAWDEACVNTAKLSECAPGCADPQLAQLDCCTASEAAGCTEPEVQDCVCSVDPFCCDQHWDAACVDHVNELGCGMCSMK